MTARFLPRDQSPADRDEEDARGSPRRAVHRIFGRHFLNAGLLVCIVVALTGPIDHPGELIKDPDLWWHLADARTLFSTHHFIRVDSYSFTVNGERWADPEWLAEIPYWLGYSSLGLSGIHFVALAGLCANLLFIYFRSYWKSRHKSAAFWTAALGFFLISINAGARTIGIAYLALSAEMAIIEAAEKGKPRLLWLVPPLFCVWINLHGSWFEGMGLLALYIVCGLANCKLGIIDQAAFSSRDRNRLLLVFLASLAALLTNPYGWRLIWNPFDIILNQTLMLATTDEWQPLRLGTLSGVAAIVFIVLLIAANCVRVRKWKIYEMAFILIVWYAAFAHQRFTFLACIVTAPWLAADLARSFMGAPSEKTVPAFNVLFVAVIAAALVFLLPSGAVLQQDFAAALPLQTVAAIQPSWRTFNDHSLGGIMDFQSKPTFIDSRNDIFEHSGVLKDYVDIEELRAPFALMDKYRIDHALTRNDSPLATALEHAPDWRLQMREGSGNDAYVLFAKMTGPDPGPAQNTSPDHP